MKNLKLLAATGVTGVLMAGAIVAPAYAWHPKGGIIKYVQNQTTGGAMADANDKATAVSTKPGDLIKYTIVISNTASAAANGDNDMYYTKLTDTLPAGVELSNDPTKRVITESLGMLKPGQTVTKEYILKVTSTKDGDVITNEACFTGDSKVNDNPQKGCNPAVITVTVPPTPTPPPTPPQTPQPPKETPKVMPATGAANLLAPVGIVTILGYAGNLLRLKRKG